MFYHNRKKNSSSEETLVRFPEQDTRNCESSLPVSTDSRMLLWDRFARDCKVNNVSDNSLATYKNAYKVFFNYMYNNKIENPTADTIVSFREWLKKDHKSNTVQLYISSLRLFFNWTSRNGLYPNIADGVKGARIDRMPKKDYFPAERVQELLN